MRILLVSDTHGNLDIINRLVEETKVDMVIHAGDFGFYDQSSYRSISSRELLLLITHSAYRKSYPIDKQTDRKQLIEIVQKHKLLGDFAEYLNKEKQFKVPVYAVYGNHEDVRVIKRLKIENPVQNLHLLDEDNIYSIFDRDELAFRLFGIGGNFLVSRKLFDQPVAGNAGKIWSTLHQFGVLYKKLEAKSKPSIFVSHVSPGKEPLLTRLLIHFMPNFWVSGHMGTPFTCVWNQFTIREMNDSLIWFASELAKLESLPLQNLTPEAQLAYDLIKREIQREEYWFKKLWNINLPDVKDGYAILHSNQGRFSLMTTGFMD